MHTPGLPPLDAAILFFLIFFVMALGAHYLYLTFRCFTAPSHSTTFHNPVLRVVQLVGTTVIYFAIAHFCVAILTTGSEPAYTGTHMLT
jgi:hypothetical protein